MGDLLGSYPKSVQMRTKLAEKTHVGLWSQSVILKAVSGVTPQLYLARLKSGVGWACPQALLKKFYFYFYLE
jgi:hypothetical protein